MFASAGGLAVLSTWADQAVLGLVEEIGDDPAWGLCRVGIGQQKLLSTLNRVRSVGYAVRASQYSGESPLANRLHALARPIFRGDTAIGALVILWPKGFAPEEFANIHLPRFREAAALITADLNRIKTKVRRRRAAKRAFVELRSAASARQHRPDNRRVERFVVSQADCVVELGSGLHVRKQRVGAAVAA